MTTLRISSCSLNQTPMDWSGNLANIKRAIELAHQSGATLLITPELSISGYGCEDFFHSPHVARRALKSVGALARFIPRSMAVSVGLPVMINNRIYNAVALVTRKGVHGMSLKRNLAANGLHYEQRWFTPWTGSKNSAVQLDGMQTATPIGNPVYQINGVKIGFEICEDAWVANRTSERFFNQGVDVIANPSASHFAIGKFRTRKRLVEESSRVYSACYVLSNLSGCESGRAIYDGGAMIAVDGMLVAKGERLHMSDVEVICADVDLSRSRIGQLSNSQRYFEVHDFDSEQTIEVGLSDSELMHKLTPTPLNQPWEESEHEEHEEALRAIALGLRDWLKKTGTDGYALSLSGGADSALVASSVYCSVVFELRERIAKTAAGSQCRLPAHLSKFLTSQRISEFDKHSTGADCQQVVLKTARAIMANMLTTAYQASANSGPVTREAAQKVAQSFGAKFLSLDISAAVDNYQAMVAKATALDLNWEEHDIALQNIQARVRSPSIWFIANLENKLLLTTSNMSEGAVGYCTMDGDSSGVLAPICGVTKTRILKLLLWLERHGFCYQDGQTMKLSALSYINNQRPTAELRPGEQRDEDDLMPFDVLDRMVFLTLEAGMPPRDTFETMTEEFTAIDKSLMADYTVKFFKLLFRNQWKRDRQAPGFHIEVNSLDPKTYKRFPLLSSGYQEELAYLESGQYQYLRLDLPGL
ncbi:NAD(+) synthase [Vibrio sp. ABG19]|uniref:NAD(+) synthase n=1 Tax=Vibrio sp. ABG19 TaxID=2817385 RepID=UPI00249EBCA8|nr:NAD(+) synthase [Vibrio sp. ABG19]WGY45692.1 NAD(+) synthase [Vibrio sp. ABG19]